MSFSGHFWTVYPRVRSWIIPPAAPAADDTGDDDEAAAAAPLALAIDLGEAAPVDGDAAPAAPAG